MPFSDFSDLVEPLRLPYNGREFTIPPVGMLDAPRILGFLAGSEVITDAELRTMLLGDAYDEMQAANVPSVFVARATLTALADLQAGRSAAEAMWETGGLPKALNAWVEQKIRTDEGTTTPTPDSGTGTTDAPNRRARRSSGRTSSNTPTSSSRTSKRSTASTSKK